MNGGLPLMGVPLGADCRDPNPGFGSLHYKSRHSDAWRGRRNGWHLGVILRFCVVKRFHSIYFAT